MGLVGEECPHCGAKLFPPRDVCPYCSGPAKTPFRFSGRGTVYSYSTLFAAPAGFESDVPYTVALVKLEEGPVVTAQLADVSPDEPYIGMAVEMVTRRVRQDGDAGLIYYNYKFRPVLQPQEQMAI
jgi:hypothetical protein